MRYFESCLTLRHRNRDEVFNHCLIHAFCEKKIYEEAGMVEPYSFSYLVGNPDAINIFVRSPASVGNIGEQQYEVSFKEGDAVSFMVDYHTWVCYRDAQGKRKHTPLTDPDKQKVKFLNCAEQYGLDIESVDVLDVISRCFKKFNKKHSFTLAGGKMLVMAKIANPATFESSFVYGIGAKRNFGFGMITALRLNGEYV